MNFDPKKQYGDYIVTEEQAGSSFLGQLAAALHESMGHFVPAEHQALVVFMFNKRMEMRDPDTGALVVTYAHSWKYTPVRA